MVRFSCWNVVKGGKKVEIPAPLHYTPLLAKAGAIILINEAEVTFSTKNMDERGFLLFLVEGKEIFL